MTAPATWRCGHARTPENTHGGTERSHAQCWTCRRASQEAADARYEERLGRLWRTMQKDQSRRRLWFEQHDPDYARTAAPEEPIGIEQVQAMERRGAAARRVRALEQLTAGWPEAGTMAERPATRTFRFGVEL